MIDHFLLTNKNAIYIDSLDYYLITAYKVIKKEIWLIY